MRLRKLAPRPDRVPGAIPIRFAIGSEHDGVQYEAFTTDQSLRGMGIRTEEPLIPGETILVSLQGKSQDPLRARVAWVRRVEDSTQYLAGLQFQILLAA